MPRLRLDQPINFITAFETLLRRVADGRYFAVAAATLTARHRDLNGCSTVRLLRPRQFPARFRGRRADRRCVGGWGQLTYGLGFGALAVFYEAVSDPPRLLWAAIGLCSVLATVVGIRCNRPRLRLPWYLVAAGSATFIAGDMTYDVLTRVFGYDNPFPSAADVLYLFTYPLFAAGLLLIVRARSVSFDHAALFDALIVAIGLGLLSWVFLVKPYVHDDSMSLLEKGVSVGYPMGDVLLLAVLTRLVVGAGARCRALRLLTVGTVGLLVSDVMYGLTQLNGSWHTGGLVDVGWIVFYGAWGAAALQSDMVELAEPVRCKATVMSRARLALLAAVSLIAPALIPLEARTVGWSRSRRQRCFCSSRRGWTG